MRGSLSVIAFSAVAGLALLCTALFGNQAELQARGAAPTIHQSPITRLHEVTARQANHSGRASSSISSGPRASRDGAIIVTNINDSGPGSLRQALADAQDGDTIQVDPALTGQTIGLTTGELVINKNITINGPGQDQI